MLNSRVLELTIDLEVRDDHSVRGRELNFDSAHRRHASGVYVSSESLGRSECCLAFRASDTLVKQNESLHGNNPAWGRSPARAAPHFRHVHYRHKSTTLTKF